MSVQETWGYPGTAAWPHASEGEPVCENDDHPSGPRRKAAAPLFTAFFQDIYSTGPLYTGSLEQQKHLKLILNSNVLVTIMIFNRSIFSLYVCVHSNPLRPSSPFGMRRLLQPFIVFYSLKRGKMSVVLVVLKKTLKGWGEKAWNFL